MWALVVSKNLPHPFWNPKYATDEQYRIAFVIRVLFCFRYLQSHDWSEVCWHRIDRFVRLELRGVPAERMFGIQHWPVNLHNFEIQRERLRTERNLSWQSVYLVCSLHYRSYFDHESTHLVHRIVVFLVLSTAIINMLMPFNWTFHLINNYFNILESSLAACSSWCSVFRSNLIALNPKVWDILRTLNIPEWKLLGYQ